MNKQEKELLEWALKNTSNKDAVGKLDGSERKELDVNEELLEAVLGVSDAKLMKECVETATNDTFDLEVRLNALDELEMLVESTYNASDIQKLHLWQPLLYILKENNDELQKMCLWVMGTAAQNNLQAQEALCQVGALPLAFDLLQHENAEVRNKALYFVSAMAKPVNGPGHAQFMQLDGLQLMESLRGDEVLKEKVDFIINFLRADAGI